MVVIRIKPG